MNTQKSMINKCYGWLATLACASLLSACGGGGGSPGKVAGVTDPTTGTGTVVSKVAKVELTASSSTILSTGAAGTEVTVTAVAKDANNSALVGETLAFTVSSGTILVAKPVTDATGTVTAVLSLGQDLSLRDITITAKDGTIVSAPLVVKVVATTSSISSIQLSSSAGSLQSGSSAGVNVIALVKAANNTIVANTPVNFSADSGALNLGTATTDAKGMATVILTTGNDPTLRAITVTANASGNIATTIVNVAGTKISLSASNSVKLNASTDMTVKLVDSANNALAGKTVTFSAVTNPSQIKVKNGGAAVTDISGQLVLTYTATSGTTDTITVKAGGDSTSATVNINSSNFTVGVVLSGAPQTLAAINTCQMIAVHDDTAGIPATGNVSITSNIGTVYSDNVCAVIASTFALNGTGDATAYVKAANPGIAVLQAAATTPAASVTGTVEFVAPLTASATISVQASPAVVGVNLAGSLAQQSTLSATVLDGTPQNNRVKNASVSFSIVNDASGGSLTSPSVVLTGSDGVASVNYIAGATNTALDGVVIQAQIQGGSLTTAANVAKLTVGQKALSITAGTGNTIGIPSSTTYQQDYSVTVTDGAGNPVVGINITGSVRPPHYYKGVMRFNGAGPWSPVVSVRCNNEDIDKTGILGSQDFNGNHILDPGLPVTITSSGVTDANGHVVMSLVYPRDRAYWIDVDFVFRGSVSGTEATYKGYTILPGLAADYKDATISPPGVVSPYGKSSACDDIL
ncbi:hypothetical protein AAKU55_004315 [Oxalobacteraceae bacterium GrIS 1.11]